MFYVPKAMPEPSPAKTKMSMEMNSATAALRASGWLASAGDPIVILASGIVSCFCGYGYGYGFSR